MHALKPCQSNEGGVPCDKDARAKCFHCSRDLCLNHLTEHAQMMERQSRSSFSSFEQTITDLRTKLDSLSMSPRIFEIPFIQLEKWRTEAHIKLDQLAEQKRQEIEEKISEYRTILLKKTHEHKQKMETIRKRFHELTRQNNANSRELKSLEEKLDQTRQFLQTLEKHSIKVSTYDFFVNIRTHFFDHSSIPRRTPPACATPVVPPPPPSLRSSRPETKEPTNPSIKPRTDKKRSLSVCLL